MYIHKCECVIFMYIMTSKVCSGNARIGKIYQYNSPPLKGIKTHENLNWFNQFIQ